MPPQNFAWRTLILALSVALACWFLPTRAGAADPAADSNHTAVRLAFTRQMFPEFNESDARAAMKIWGEMLVNVHGVPADPNPPILEKLSDLADLLEARAVDMVGVTLQELAVLRARVKFDTYTAAVHGNEITEQYVLLVHADSGITNLVGLKAGKLSVWHSSRMNLATLWLDTLLMEAGLPVSAEHCGPVTLNSKAPRVILPVFFRQSDACLVLRRSYQTMCELNPQLSRQLRELAVSEPVVPAVTAMRADFHAGFRQRFLEEVQRIHTTVAGQQVLNVFQSDRIELCPAEQLESGLALIRRHQKLRDQRRPAEVSVR